jgi:hypothetical protein
LSSLLARLYRENLAFFIQVFVRCYICAAREVSGKTTTIENSEISSKKLKLTYLKLARYCAPVRIALLYFQISKFKKIKFPNEGDGNR